MSLLNDVIGSALRDHNVPQVGGAGTTPLAEVLRSLLAPRSAAAGAPPDDTHIEPDAMQQLLARFQQVGFADIVRSWISDEKNAPIEPHQVGAALGDQKVDELSRDSGLPRNALLGELARLLPTIIDRLTPQGKLPREQP